MKKINLKGISEVLTEKELKNVMGGSTTCSSCSSNYSCTVMGRSGNCGWNAGYCACL